jgi:hypothetical protein
LCDDSFSSFRRRVRQKSLYGFQVGSRRRIDCGVDALLKSDVADPEEREERHGENREIEEREPRSNGEVQAQGGTPTEYPRPRCVWIRPEPTSSIFLRSNRTKASIVLTSTSRRSPQMASTIAARGTIRV